MKNVESSAVPATSLAGRRSSPLLAPDDPPGARRRRIARGILRQTTWFVGLTLAAPLVLTAAAVVDLALWLRRRKPWMAVRLVAIVWCFLLGELRSLAAVLRLRLACGGRDTPARRRRTFDLQMRWATRNLDTVTRICRLRFDVANDDVLREGPMIVFSRHASVIDNALPAARVSRAHGIDLRYALKAELQSLPALDIGARWVPTCFVRRASDDPARQIARVRSLATGLYGPRDGVLIFPEGTRYTAAKLAALKARDDLRDPELPARVARLKHVLPPRLGGPLAVIDEAPHAAVVFCGHAGLDGFHDLREMWSGDIVGTTVRVRFWRHEPDEIPADLEGRATWLYDRWEELDRWVEDQCRGDAPSPHLFVGVPDMA